MKYPDRERKNKKKRKLENRNGGRRRRRKREGEKLCVCVSPLLFHHPLGFTPSFLPFCPPPVFQWEKHRAVARRSLNIPEVAV
jgi:hypothetical protein